MAYDVYIKLNEDELMLEKLEAHEKYIMDRETALAIAKREGKEEGAKQNSKTIAYKLLQKNMPIHEIIETTELTAEEIEEIKKNGI